MAMNDLHELFVHKLAQQYYVEQELVETLDEMARDTTNDRMSQGFADHRDETRTQIQRIEEVFAALDRPRKRGSVPSSTGSRRIDANSRPRSRTTNCSTWST